MIPTAIRIINQPFVYKYLFTFQISLQQKIQSLDDMTRDRDDAISKLDKSNLRLDEANVKLAK